MPPSDELSKTQVDRLGDRLRKGDISEADLRLLDSYRRSFAEAYECVVRRIRDQLKLEPTGRPAKSTTSIVDKLQRESVRLSQMQDIAGCRLTVADITVQDNVITQLKTLFDKVTIVDRRELPSHGYRAVHVIVDSSGQFIEIQVRTSLQHLWAELSEKFSDVIGPEIKYGKGDQKVLESLSVTSDMITDVEVAERTLNDILSTVAPGRTLSENMNRKVSEARELIGDRRRRAASLISLLRDVTLREKGREDALFD